jgi:hypothetical protein
MATESPALHDGSQMQAGVNLGLSAGLNGPNGSGQFLGMVITGARTVANDTVGGAVIYGILQNTPPLGQAADIVIFGVTKAVAGAAFAAGADLMTDSSGRLITATSTNHRCAIAIEAAAVAGQLITVFFTAANRTA